VIRLRRGCHRGQEDADEGATGSTSTARSQLDIEAEVDNGDLASRGQVPGRLPKGIRGIRFPRPEWRAAPAGLPAVVTAD